MGALPLESWRWKRSNWRSSFYWNRSSMHYKVHFYPRCVLCIQLTDFYDEVRIICVFLVSGRWSFRKGRPGTVSVMATKPQLIRMRKCPSEPKAGPIWHIHLPKLPRRLPSQLKVHLVASGIYTFIHWFHVAACNQSHRFGHYLSHLRLRKANRSLSNAMRSNYKSVQEGNFTTLC